MFNVANIPRHKMAVHSNANYSCFICNVPYNSIRSLRSHFSSVHFEHKLEEKKCSRCNITVPVKYIDAHNEVCIRFELNFFSSWSFCFSVSLYFKNFGKTQSDRKFKGVYYFLRVLVSFMWQLLNNQAVKISRVLKFWTHNHLSSTAHAGVLYSFLSRLNFKLWKYI